MAITDSALTSSVWEAVKDELVSLAPFVTNSTTAETSAASIKAVYNDSNGSRPQIVIRPIGHQESGWKFGSYEGKKFITVDIDFYYQNTLGIEQMYDQVVAQLKTNPIDGIQLIAIASDYGFSTENSDKYHVKTLTLSYDRE